MLKNEYDELVGILRGEAWHVRKRLKAFIDTAILIEDEKPKGTRTSAQNRAVHMDCKLIAEKLNAAGRDMRVVLKPTYAVPWTTESVKEHIWKPIMKALTGKESTTELAKLEGEIERIHDTIMRELGEKHGIEHHDFPFDPQKRRSDLLDGMAIDVRDDEGYPELTDMPTL